MKFSGLLALAGIIGLCGCATYKIPVQNTAKLKTLSDDFVFLRQIDPSITQYIRYHTADNFMGEKIDGYNANECILKKDAAIAIKNVQIEANKLGYALIVFDCYRPQKAVNHMVRWVTQSDKTNPNYFATLPRNTLIEKGYISDKSNHSKGYTIDLALIKSDKSKLPQHKYYACAKRKENYTLDFGTPFDCFDSAANTFNPIITGEALKNRKILVDLMSQQGFDNYDMEWWHFTHKSKPKDAPAFDFNVAN